MRTHMSQCAISALLAGAMAIMGACTSSGGFFTAGPRPTELAGVWIDVAKTTPTDTLAWLLEQNGADRTLQVRQTRDQAGVLRREELKRAYGAWYMSGQLRDTTGRALCFKPHARFGPTCFGFRLDTLTTAPVRRRLTILGYRGNHSTADRVLIERLP